MKAPNISLDDAAVRCQPGPLRRITTQRNQAVIDAGDSPAELTLVAAGVVHVLWRPGESWQNEPTRYLRPAARPNRLSWRRSRQSLRAANMTIDCTADPARLSFADERGVFLRELAGGSFGYLDAGVAIRWRFSPRERIYGLGSNSGAALDRAGRLRTLAAMHKGGEGGDLPIAAWISSRGYGVVIDNPNVATLDLRRRGEAHFHATDGYLSYYVLWGPAIADVLERLAVVTGRSPLPPKWFFGPMFSRVPGGPAAGYRSAAEFVALGRKLRARDIPADALILDYQWDERIGAFHWDREKFPRPAAMTAELDKLGIRTIVQLKPAVNVPARTMPAIREQELALTRRDGSVHTCNFHRGRSVFLDFFKPATRRWYAERIRGLLRDGVGGIWTDEGDWLGFEAPAARDLQRSAPGMRNLYNNAWAEAIDEACRGAGERRTINITRAGSAGIQRFGTTIWSGDVMATWEGLADQLQMGLSAAMSGIPFWTTDGGGFIGTPTPELYVRWAQFAVFSPITRFHGLTVREPWAYGKRAEVIVREALDWRIRLLPYVYAMAWQAHSRGLPLMRPVALLAPDEARLGSVTAPYLFGDSLLVHPLTKPLAALRREGGVVRSPAVGGTWFDWATGAPQVVREGSAVLEQKARLERIPVYVQAPAIVPLGRPGPCAGGQQWDELTLRVYVDPQNPEAAARFELYEDDGETRAYERGQYRLTQLSFARAGGNAWRFTSRPRGAFPGRKRRRYTLEVYGVSDGANPRPWRIGPLDVPADKPHTLTLRPEASGT